MKRFFRFRGACLVLMLALPPLASCKDEQLQGTYTATSFSYALIDAPLKDVLAAGGSISMVISGDLSTSGTMVIPASVTGTTATSVSLLGGAARQGDNVTLNLVQQSVLSGITLVFDGTSLTADGTNPSGVYVKVTLSK